MKYKLSQICDYAKGKTSVARLNNKNYISTENMLPNRGGVVCATTLPTTEYTQEYCSGDVLVSNIRPYFKKIWFAESDGGCSNDVLVFRAKEGVNSKYLYYVLANDAFFNYAYATSKGTKMPRGDKLAIMEYEIEKHEPKEQKKIAEILSAIDKKIAINNAINHNLQQQGIAIVENYLTNTENEILLGDIMSFDNGFAFQSNTYQQNGTYRVITIKNVQDGYIDSSDASYVSCIPPKMKSCCVLHEGDALLSLTGNVGRVGIVYEPNLLLNQRVAKVVPYEKSLQGFVYFLLRHPSMKSRMETIAKGTAQQNLSPVETLKLSITFQFDTVSAITNQLNAFYEQLVALFIENKQLAALRDTLLPKLMSGEIDVSDVEF